MTLNIELPMSAVSAVSALQTNDHPCRATFDLRAHRRVRDRAQVFALGDVIPRLIT